MVSKRRNGTQADFDRQSHIINTKKHINQWELQKTVNQNIQSILDKSSKKGVENNGCSDLVHVIKNKMPTLIENKANIKQPYFKIKKCQ